MKPHYTLDIEIYTNSNVIHNIKSMYGNISSNLMPNKILPADTKDTDNSILCSGIKADCVQFERWNTVDYLSL